MAGIGQDASGLYWVTECAVSGCDAHSALRPFGAVEDDDTGTAVEWTAFDLRSQALDDIRDGDEESPTFGWLALCEDEWADWGGWAICAAHMGSAGRLPCKPESGTAWVEPL